MSVLGVVTTAGESKCISDAALDVVSIATGINLRMANKEDDTMQKRMSSFEKFFTGVGIEIGKEEGIEIGKERGIEIGKEKGIEIGRKEGRKEGRNEGRDETVMQFIQGKRNYNVPDIQIHEELLKFFKLDNATASRYMEGGQTKA